VTTPASVEADLGWALGTVMRTYLHTSQEALAGVPGGPRGYLVLAASNGGEPSSQLALAQRLGVDRTVMTYLLDDLEGAGLVERKPDPADRRARRIVLTEPGRVRLCDLERRLRAAEDHVLEPLEPAERDTLRALLHRLATGTAGDGTSPCSVADEIQAMDAVESPPARGRRKR
jgi:DNA-binding MarR family transcriptional regulator